VLVDAIAEHEPGRRLVAHKNVTINEDFFQGHFPGVPLMPGVLMLETLTQVAAALVLEREGPMPMSRVYLHGVNDAKFRRQVVPGDQLRVEVTLGRTRTSLAKARAIAYVGDQIVAEAELLLALTPDGVRIHPTAVVMKGAEIGDGTVVGANAVVGEHVKLGRRCRIGASAVVDGFTSIGDGTEIFPFASIGLIPQDLKFKGEETHLKIGKRNIFREFVTIHRGTRGGGGQTTCQRGIVGESTTDLINLAGSTAKWVPRDLFSESSSCKRSNRNSRSCL
jgi:beta-hydroxyacyl-ACP dehydratase FabZ